MRIDFEKREISCCVGDLVQDATYRRIGVERGDGFRRMWLGQEIHSRRAEEQAGEDQNYRSEVSVSYVCDVRGWHIEISGRIDGLSIDREAAVAVIEEVKSLHFDLELDALFRSEKLQRHLFQLMLYAYFLSHDDAYRGLEFRPHLALIDLITGRVETVDAPYEPEEVESAFGAVVERLVERIETSLALREAKRAFADELSFPHLQLRAHQQTMIDSVGRAIRQQETLLVSAPTGVGKTIAALYPALKESLRLGKKLFFLTSKTLQQQMAVDALASMNDGSFRVLRLRSKQKMCAHTEVICHEDHCPFAAAYGEKMKRSSLHERIVSEQSYFDPDVTFELAKSEEVCPFEVSLELIEDADVIVCDYNYIFDPYVGLKTYQQDEDYGDCILLIDEAHNLVDRGRGYYSPELRESWLDDIRLHLASRPGCDLEGWEELADELREHMRDLAQSSSAFTDDARLSIRETTPARFTGASRQALCDPDARLFVRQRAEWERLVMRYIAWKIEHRIADENDPLVDFYFKLVKFTNMMSDSGDELARIVEQTNDGAVLRIFCKDPSRFLGRIIDSSHATVAMSATLEPFDFYRNLLGFPRRRTCELALPSPFPRENRKIVVVPGVDTTYRERAQHYQRIADVVGEMASSTEGNFLALFPSYVFLQEVSERLPRHGKELLVQRNDMTDWERSSFLEALRLPRANHLVLAVAGGMYAEGVDYRGDMLSGVFVVGPALPTVSFEQELLKTYYDEHYGAGFEYAYLIPGMTRVIQSAGRVIRSERDIGIIALLCKRFTQQNYTKFFPSDWYEETPRELVSRDPAAAIRDFFEQRRPGQLSLMQKLNSEFRIQNSE